jgi:hypothetical protein
MPRILPQRGKDSRGHAERLCGTQRPLVLRGKMPQKRVTSFSMRLILIFFCYLLLPAVTFSQASDFITVKKKNNRTMKSYFPGSPITCQTVYGNYFNGYVEAVRNDSVFIKQYDIRPVPGIYGAVKMDTLTSYINGVHYKDIRAMIFEKRRSFGFLRNGTILIIGGLGYAGLNVVNGKYLGEPIMKGGNLKRLGIAFGVAGTGFLMKYLNNRSEHNERKYRVEYIKMTTPKPRGA